MILFIQLPFVNEAQRYAILFLLSLNKETSPKNWERLKAWFKEVYTEDFLYSPNNRFMAFGRWKMISPATIPLKPSLVAAKSPANP